MIPDIPQSKIVYRTRHGIQLCGDSCEVLGHFADSSIDLIVTSPPFALLRKKTYGNKEQGEYVSWLAKFGRAAFPKLKESGSFVIDLGGSYERGKPVRSLYNFRVLLEFCDHLGYRFAEDFYWFNPAKLPSPIEWVNRRKMRAKDSVNTVWWFSKGDWPKADVTKVLTPYSDRMKKLLQNPEGFYAAAKRPSGHDISKRFADGANEGALPSNLLQIPNTDSNSHYLRTVKELGKERHPARFPTELPAFFIKFLTDPGDLVVDIFSGSNTTGQVAESLGRTWASIDADRRYAELSAVRFMEGRSIDSIRNALDLMEAGTAVDIESHVMAAKHAIEGSRADHAKSKRTRSSQPVGNSARTLF